MRLLNILKENNIIKVSPEDTLSQVLSKLFSSHDAAFVFDPAPRRVQGKQNDNFLGVVNPYYSVIQASHPGNTKVIHCLSHPPKIYLNYPLRKVCELFIQSRIHYLPVFDSKSSGGQGKPTENFLGIISARRVLDYLKDLPIFKVKIDKVIKKRWWSLITVVDDEMISHAIHLFKEKKISKLVVINHEMKLKGVLTYYDVINYMISPKFSPARGERAGNKISFYNLRVKTFAKSHVLTLTKNNYLSEAIKLIIDKKIGSVVIVDEVRRPIGIITSRDLLQFYIQNEKQGFFKRFPLGIDRFFS
jgi:predicted transcriptional regulator